MRIGVLLPQPPDALGGWLADAAAFDAAGADALWIDPLSDAGLDPLAMAAALAGVTYRALLVAVLPAEMPGSTWARGRTLGTIDRLSNGRLAVCGERARVAEVAWRDSFYRLDAGTFVRQRVGGSLAEARSRPAPLVEPERWVRVAPPAGRAGWAEEVTTATEQGAGGLLVPAEARLLDILRNPDDPGERRDLQLANG